MEKFAKKPDGSGRASQTLWGTCPKCHGSRALAIIYNLHGVRWRGAGTMARLRKPLAVPGSDSFCNIKLKTRGEPTGGGITRIIHNVLDMPCNTQSTEGLILIADGGNAILPGIPTPLWYKAAALSEHFYV